MKDYKAGFTTNGSHPIETVEWLLSEKDSSDIKLLFQAYDANLCPLPDLSKWKDKQYIDKQISKGIEVVQDFNGEVWLDDIKIK